MPHLQKRVQAQCSQCETFFETTPSRVARYPHIFCGLPCRNKWRTENMCGENAPSWKGGKATYYGPNWKEQRRRARKRDNYTCQQCGKTEASIGEQLHVHHMMPFRTFGYIAGVNNAYVEANRLSNLVSLCQLCHIHSEPRDMKSHPLLNSKPKEIRRQAIVSRIEKPCFSCKLIKPLAEFHTKNNALDGHAGTCKVCDSEQRKKKRLLASANVAHE